MFKISKASIVAIFQTYFANLKQIGQNLLLVYRNFLHWNISKILIFLYANVAGFVLSIPFLAVFVYQYNTIYNTLALETDPTIFIADHYVGISVTLILLVCIITIFICTYTYSYFLMQNVYKHYLAGEKLPYGENLYFSWKHIVVYIGILGWISLYLLIPMVVLPILAIPFGLGTKFSPLLFGGISLMVFVLFFIGFIYLATRLSFAYFALLYSADVEKAKAYTDRSFALTKGKVWKILLLAIPFLLLFGVFGVVIETGERTIAENRVYDALVQRQSITGQDDHKLMEQYFIGNDDEKTDFGDIEKLYTPKKDGIDRKFLHQTISYIDTKAIDTGWWIYAGIFMIFSFLVLDGVTSMIYLSIYHILVASSASTDTTATPVTKRKTTRQNNKKTEDMNAL